MLGFSTPFTGADRAGLHRDPLVHRHHRGRQQRLGPVVASTARQYLFRGGLWGGSALCSNPQGTDNYSRFDLAYPQLAPVPRTASNAPFADFTDLWWGGPSESGWGLNLIQHPSNQIFGVWYTYERGRHAPCGS